MTAASLGGGVGTDASLTCAAVFTEVDVLTTFSITGLALTAWNEDVTGTSSEVDAGPRVAPGSEWPGCSVVTSVTWDIGASGSPAPSSAIII